MGKPVVSTNVGDVPLYVRDGECGYIVDLDDGRAMSERIGLLSTEPGLRKSMGQRAREIAVHELDIRLCAERHMAAYQEMLKND